jgi:hypothetical protein
MLKEHHTLKCDIRNSRQILQYYRFGSCNENKKGNYIHNLQDSLILDIYKMEYLNKRSLILEDQWNFIYQFQLKELFWDDDAISKTKTFMNSIFDCLTKDRAKRLQYRKRMISDPITKKYKRLRLEQKIGKGLTDAFCHNNDGSRDYLCKFCSKFGVESKFLRKYNNIVYPHIGIMQLPTTKDQSDVIKMFKWREIDEVRNVRKVTKVVEMFNKKIAKGKIYLEIEVFGKQRNFKFYKFMPSSLPGNYRSIFIKKDIDAEAGKSNRLVDDIIRSIGKSSYCRSNFRTRYLEEYVIEALYSEVVEEKISNEEEKDVEEVCTEEFPIYEVSISILFVGCSLSFLKDFIDKLVSFLVFKWWLIVYLFFWNIFLFPCAALEVFIVSCTYRDGLIIDAGVASLLEGGAKSNWFEFEVATQKSFEVLNVEETQTSKKQYPMPTPRKMF